MGLMKAHLLHIIVHIPSRYLECDWEDKYNTIFSWQLQMS